MNAFNIQTRQNLLLDALYSYKIHGWIDMHTLQELSLYGISEDKLQEAWEI